MNLFALNAANMEYHALSTLDHRNILKCKGYFEDTAYLIIVSELQSTDMQSLVTSLDAPMTESHVKTIFH